MSQIITSLVCASCGHEWNGYITFGHPEKTFEHKWACEKCGAENSHTVDEWIKSDGQQNGVCIYRGDPTTIVRVFTTMSEGIRSIPVASFQWKEIEDEEYRDCFDGFLTLEDISDQLKKLHSANAIGVVYVWIESALYGAIYQFGNYDDIAWRLYCKTPGYA